MKNLKKNKKLTHEHDHITRSGRKEGEKHYNLHYKKQCYKFVTYQKEHPGKATLRMQNKM